jgi:CDP-paratose 2-epimerase
MMSYLAKTVLITGSSGLIGSEAVTFFDQLGWQVYGIDNNMRRDFFGPDGDTLPNLERLRRTTSQFTHHDLDLRDRERVLALVEVVRPGAILHCASQPSHDLARDRPFDDFEINAAATLTVLEAARRFAPGSPFVFMSTNKVYGDAPNERPLRELPTRWEYADAADYHGIDETCRVDASLHSLFGVSKLAADALVQEYGRYFGLPTVCFRGGCLTGPQHAGAEMHGFLAYIARALKEGRPYRIYGYKGKQVRDNLHAYDVCQAFWEFIRNPRCAAVYNLGGGRDNSISVLEAIAAFEERAGRKLQVEYRDENRVGDHVCYISDLRRFRADYPGWSITRPLHTILNELGEVTWIRTLCRSRSSW